MAQRPRAGLGGTRLEARKLLASIRQAFNTDGSQSIYYGENTFRPKRKPRSKSSRLRLLARDSYQCWVCKGHLDPDLSPNHPLSYTLDHVIPLARGGKDSEKNLKAAHRRCNEARGSQTLKRSVIQPLFTKVHS